MTPGSRTASNTRPHPHRTGSQRLKEQDADGIDAEVLSPTGCRSAVVAGDSGRRCLQGRRARVQRLVGRGLLARRTQSASSAFVIPWTNVDDAIEELEHCAKIGTKPSLGTFPSGRATSTRRTIGSGGCRRQRPGDHSPRRVRPQRLPGWSARYPREPRELRSERGIAGVVEQVTNPKFCRLGAVNAVQLMFARVFDRFSTLRIFFAENQIGWIPFFLEMADVRYDRHSGWAERLLDVKPLARTPERVHPRTLLLGLPARQSGRELRRHLGVDRIIWSTDFPHQESDWPNSLEVLQDGMVGVPEDEQRLMVAQNTIDFFHL